MREVERPTLRLVNHVGRPFVARLLMVGARFGLNDVLVIGGPEARDWDQRPQVEFWDATYADDPRFTRGLGQFTGGRYGVDTLLVDHTPGAGLTLHGGVSVWALSPENLAEVRRWLVGGVVLPEKEAGALPYRDFDCAAHGHVEALPFPGCCVMCGRHLSGDAPVLGGGLEPGDAPALGGAR